MASPLVVPLAAVGAGDRSAVGGKGASLGELVRAGLRVPRAWVVTTAAFASAMRVIDPERSIAREISQLDPDDHDDVMRVTAGIRDRIESAPLPGALATAITAAYRQLDHDAGEHVAVRSSATGEDADAASFAGLQDTYLWVRGGEEVAGRVRRCWSSLYSVESVTYRLRRGLPEEAMAMAVVIQQMVDARSAGVMFTRGPTTGDPSVVAIEAGWGLGSAVVSGEVTPDTYVVNKVTGEILRRTVASKLRWHRPAPAGSGMLAEEVPPQLRDEPCLSDAEVLALARLAREVERHHGAPQDIEWAVARDLPPERGLFLLQSRPETVWSGRQTTPIATPKPRAFDHLAALFSGPGTTTGGGGARRA
jgi:pyruvate,water dikinase